MTRNPPGRPSLGPRAELRSRVPMEVKNMVKKIQSETGLSESQIAADLLSCAVGRPDLARRVHTPIRVQTCA